MPFKENSKQLEDSFEQAKRRFYSLEKRLASNPNTQQRYKDFIQEFIDLKHLEVVPSEDLQKSSHQAYYLPHHCVFKDDSTTTKLRVVFDASAKSQSGVSSNDILHTGATVQSDLFSILLRYRFHRFVISGDIAKMYRQIALDDSVRDFHRILWRNDKNEPLLHYRMTRVTYGVKPSAFLATRCVKEIGQKSGGALFASSIENDFYVDDYLSGASTKQEAKDLMLGVIAELKKYGMELRKWTSNAPELIFELPENLRENSNQDKLFDESYQIKALGVKWRPNTDQFCFQVTLEPITTFTKRSLLSDISKLFDPLGWLAPVIIIYKVLMQETWTAGTKWDQELPSHVIDRWFQLRNQLPLLNDLQLPRCILPPQECVNFQLHLFTDASEQAYAAAIYSRMVDCTGTVSVNLLASKTRVTPVKTVSLPRLELCAAHLGIQLLKTVIKVLNLVQYKNYDIFAWSDSTIVLQWISQLPRKWTTFVANRVAQIQDVTEPSQWNHVPSQSNPADLPTRGISPSELLVSKLWWNGPIWLSCEADAWPQMPTTTSTVPEKRKSSSEEDEKSTQRTAQTFSVCITDTSDDLVNVERFSKLSRLLRTTVFVLRARNIFLLSLKKERRPVLKEITFEELQNAKFLLVSQLQRNHFSKEFKQLQQQKPLDRNSSILNLTPFFDADYDVIRVGGRLGQSSYREDKKFPLLLPKESHFTTLVIHSFHEASLHGGGQLTLNLIREEYWPIAGKVQVKSMIRQCIKCRRFDAKAPIQMMADLPTERITPSKPFVFTGIDFAGPIITLPNEKTYIAIFLCFVVKATHLELVSSLTKEACLNALQRFTSRRGVPQKIYSDNGRNFTGARSDLLKIQDLMSKNSENTITDFGTELGASWIILENHENPEWIMIPPRAPHFGGLWEAAVRRMKHHLRRSLGSQILTYEELLNYVTQIESIMNSRPLYPLSTDPNDLEVLTPAHFLIGQPFRALPLHDLPRSFPLDQRFRLLQNLISSFWIKWKRDYLVHLQIRKRWFKDGERVSVGDMVLVAEDNQPPLCWKLGRVISGFEGNDNINRVVKVKTTQSEIVRPVVKLRKLFSEEEVNRSVP